MATLAWGEARINTADAAGILVARIKALQHAASTWSRKRRSTPTSLHNCSFIILLLDLFEETRTLSTGEQMLRKLCRDRAALFIKEQAAFWKQRGKYRAEGGRCQYKILPRTGLRAPPTQPDPAP